MDPALGAAARSRWESVWPPGLWAKLGPELKGQTLPWVLPVQGGARGATGTISDMRAMPRSPVVSRGKRPQGE